MMGQHDRSEALFYYFRLEDQIPETHLLRLIDKHISFEFVRQQLKDNVAIGRAVAVPAQGRQTQRMGRVVSKVEAALNRKRFIDGICQSHHAGTA